MHERCYSKMTVDHDAMAPRCMSCSRNARKCSTNGSRCSSTSRASGDPLVGMLQASGDTFTGTLLLKLPPGMPAEAEPSPVKGTRVKG